MFEFLTIYMDNHLMTKFYNVQTHPEQTIEGISLDPVEPPDMNFIDPHRRSQTDLAWLKRPFIVTRCDGFDVYCLGPSSYRPDLWGRFETLRAAVDYIQNPLTSTRSEPDDYDMNF